MKIDVILDHKAIAEGLRSEIFFALRLRTEAARPTKAAYTLLLDRASAGFENATAAAALFIKHLPPEAHFSLIAFDEAAEVALSENDAHDKESLEAVLSEIEPTDSFSNAAAAWRLAMEQVDGGTVLLAPSNEAPLAFVQRHLGLLQTSVKNVRLRLRRSEFCEGIHPLTRIGFDDGEFLLGDLLAGDDHTFCFNLFVQPLPCIDGKPISTYLGEALAELELSWEENGVRQTHRETIRSNGLVEFTEKPGAAESPMPLGSRFGNVEHAGSLSERKTREEL